MLHKAWTERGKACGCRKLHDDLLEQGDSMRPNRLAGIKAQIGYKRRPGSDGGKPLAVVNAPLLCR